jgi:hypothetical protein
MSAPKVALPLYDFDSGSEVFVDEFASIEEHGVVTHLLFAVRRMDGDCKPARYVRLRVVIPSDKRQEIARHLLASGGNALSHTTATEGEALH